jgi:hypothetical protein
VLLSTVDSTIYLSFDMCGLASSWLVDKLGPLDQADYIIASREGICKKMEFVK